MGSDEFKNIRFDNDDEMVKYVTEHADSIDKLQIMVVNDIVLKGPDGRSMIAKDRCAMMKLCSGESFMIPTEVLQKVLDQGVIHRMQIPIQLIPREAR